MNRDPNEHDDEAEQSVASDGSDGRTPGSAPAGHPGPGHGWAPGPGAYPQPYVLRRPMNNLAIAALVVGVVSLVSCPLIGAIAVYLGNRARGEIRTTGEDGDGMALAGVIIGWCTLGLAVLSILLVAVYIGILGMASS